MLAITKPIFWSSLKQQVVCVKDVHERSHLALLLLMVVVYLQVAAAQCQQLRLPNAWAGLPDR
jgi:hypothetical protein